MSECVKKGEMPVWADRLKSFDSDNSGGLSPAELDKIVKSPLADELDVVFKLGLKAIHPDDCIVSPEWALEVYEKLSADTRLKIITPMFAIESNNPVAKFRRLLITNKTNQLAQDFLKKYKNAGADNSKKERVVSTVINFITDFPYKEQMNFLRVLETADSSFANAVKKQIEKNLVPKDFDSVIKAINHIGKVLDEVEGKTNVKPIIFGIGEEHPSIKQLSKARIPAEHFGETILPELVKKHGVKIVSGESIPSDAKRFGPIDLNNPAIKYVMENRPQVARSLSAIIKAVQKLRSEGHSVEIVGVGPTISEIADFELGQSKEEVLIDAINKNVAAFSKKLTEKDGNAVIYSGSLHNDFVNLRHNGTDFSYVSKLSKKVSFVSIDLVVPDYLQHATNAAEWNAKEYSPKRGVRLFKRGLKSDYIIVFPRDLPTSSQRPKQSFMNRQRFMRSRPEIIVELPTVPLRIPLDKKLPSK